MNDLQLSTLQRSFEDQALTLMVARQSGKSLPHIKTCEDICKDIAKLIKVLREDE